MKREDYIQIGIHLGVWPKRLPSNWSVLGGLGVFTPIIAITRLLRTIEN